MYKIRCLNLHRLLDAIFFVSYFPKNCRLYYIERAADTDKQRDEALEQLAAEMSGDEVEAITRFSR